MSVEKFLEDLNFLLQDLPEDERKEALEFYRCYFEDAGEENKEAVFAELGSPEKVAYTIREGLRSEATEGEFTETGYRTYEDLQTPATKEEEKQSGQQQEQAEDYHYGAASGADQVQGQHREKRRRSKTVSSKPGHKGKSRKQTQSKKKQHNPVVAVLLGILKVLMVIAAICIVILLIAALVAIVIALGASFVVMIALLVIGIGMLAGGMGLAGVVMIGIAFIAVAVTLLILLGLVAFCKKGLGGGIRGITSLTGNIVYERKWKAV